jgi:flagellar basal-body rod protein FlgB
MAAQPSVVNFLESGLNASLLRQRVVANNIANLNTPGFRRNTVNFEKILNEAIESPGGIDKQELADLKGELLKPMDTPVRRNGNDVNLDLEVGELLKASSRHKAYLRILNKMYRQMEMAMQDRL